jgi:riboflavin kinase/FMN adenylyltransferase
MDVIHYPDDPRPARWRQPVLALGNFDGLHLGHMTIVEQVVSRARERSATPLLLTFDPHPTRVVRPEHAPSLLMTVGQRLEVAGQMGVEGAGVVRFTHEVAGWDPETFVRLVLVDWLHVSEVWVGANFLFGHDRSGNFVRLRELGARYGFGAEKIDPVRFKEFVVSSSRVRSLVTAGKMQEAAELLGRHYFMDGTVVHGLQRGRALGFPTANLNTANELTPPSGVYATLSTVDDVVYPSVTNIGVRPTFHQPSATVIETHLLDVDRDLYGARLRVAFLQRVRNERTFASVDELKAHIAADCAQVRAFFFQLGGSATL